MNTFKGLSIRKLQALAALCLAKFCAVEGIQHSAIDQLIQHLLDILIVEDLCAWDNQGKNLEITGRGDPMPTSVKKVLSDDQENSLYFLAERVVEVGIVDMYGARTTEPVRFLKECVTILKKAGGDIPSIGSIFTKGQTEDEFQGWGLPLKNDEYEQFILMFNELITTAKNEYKGRV